MKQQTKTLLVWLGLIVAVLALANLFNSSQQTTEQSYSKFVRELDDLKANETHLELEVHPSHVDISYKRDDKTVEVTGPVTEELYKKLDFKEIQYSVEPEDDSSLLQFAIMWLPMILIVIIMIMFMRQMQAGGGKAMSFGKARARLLTEHQGKVTFKDVAGIDEAREEVEEIIDFLRDTRKYMRVGGRIPKGVLLMGPPGTGKTLLARAIAGEAGVSFFSISGSDFVEMFVGVGASRVRDLFEQGKKNAPCIIFIDEIDAVGRHRGAGLGGGHDEREQTLNQLLVEMDGFESNDGVILVAATNRPDVLDPALLRPGRFDRRIIVDLPDVRGREAILNVHTRKVALEEGADMSTIAKATPGFSGADLENLVNEAALLAARHDKDRVTLHELDAARDKVIMGPERKSLNMSMSQEEKRTTAWHEAGHALVAMKLPQKYVDPIHKVTIVPRGRALGGVHRLAEERHDIDRRYIEAMIAMLMGGRVAEECALGGQKTAGAANDIERASGLARKMVCEWGMSDKIGPIAFSKGDSEPFLGRDIARPKAYSEATAQAIDAEVHEIVMTQYNRAKELITTHSDALERLATVLIERETLGLEEVAAAIDGRPLPPFGGTPSKPSTAETTSEDSASSGVGSTGLPVAEPT